MAGSAQQNVSGVRATSWHHFCGYRREARCKPSSGWVVSLLQRLVHWSGGRCATEWCERLLGERESIAPGGSRQRRGIGSRSPTPSCPGKTGWRWLSAVWLLGRVRAKCVGAYPQGIFKAVGT